MLRDLGYIEGRNIHPEFRDAGGYADRLPMLAEQLVQEGVSMSLPQSACLPRSPPTKPLHTIPVVGFVAADPVAAGFAKSLAHPEGNVTGVAVFAEEADVKRVELMREVAPRAVRLAMIATQIGLIQQSLERPMRTCASITLLSWTPLTKPFE